MVARRTAHVAPPDQAWARYYAQMDPRWAEYYAATAGADAHAAAWAAYYASGQVQAQPQQQPQAQQAQPQQAQPLAAAHESATVDEDTAKRRDPAWAAYYAVWNEVLQQRGDNLGDPPPPGCEVRSERA